MMLRNYRPFSVKPKLIKPIYTGYVGLSGGIAVSWLGKFVYIVRPVNERNAVLRRIFGSLFLELARRANNGELFNKVTTRDQKDKLVVYFYRKAKFFGM